MRVVFCRKGTAARPQWERVEEVRGPGERMNGDASA